MSFESARFQSDRERLLHALQILGRGGRHVEASELCNYEFSFCDNPHERASSALKSHPEVLVYHPILEHGLVDKYRYSFRLKIVSANISQQQDEQDSLRYQQVEVPLPTQ